MSQSRTNAARVTHVYSLGFYSLELEQCVLLRISTQEFVLKGEIFSTVIMDVVSLLKTNDL